MSPRAGRLLRLPPRIVLDVEAELGDYLLGELRRDWPQAQVRRPRSGQAPVADLMVVDREPSHPPSCPTLWLATIDANQALIQIAPGLWRTAMPTTAARLRQTLNDCLRALNAP